MPENKGVSIRLSVPRGAEAALKTYNPRLGITGGISIIGTTGIVTPMSEDAWKETLALEVKVMAAKGVKDAVFVFGNYPAGICKELLAKGICHVRVVVGEKLSYTDERIIEGMSEDVCNLEFDSLSILFIKNDDMSERTMQIWDYETGGIPDELFIRGEVPMTEEFLRQISSEEVLVYEDI